MAYPAEIIKSGVSVYEVELDLDSWRETQTQQVPFFHEVISKTIPSLKEHKCMTGKPGGFLLEVQKGTNFAHVIEHIILELIHLADAEKQLYTGWTRELDKGRQIYVIHYSAPNFLTGRLAAILAVELTKKLLDRTPVDVGHAIELLRQPLQYFTMEDHARVFEKLGEPISVIQETEEAPFFPPPRPVPGKLSEKQIANLGSVLRDVRRHLGSVVDSWKISFLEYSGNFGKAIIDKMELLNIDQYTGWFISGEFDRCYRGIKKASQLIGSYRIPLNFVVHSIWLYKNKLQTYIIEEYGENKAFLDQALKDFDDFFQILLQKAWQGFSEQDFRGGGDPIGELKKFTELKKRKGSILVVDDDEMVRSACRDILEYQGFWALLAKDGNEALEILSKKKEEIALVILDFSLPDTTGREACLRIRELSPAVKILIMAGYSVNEELKNMSADRAVDFIHKPFTAEALGAKVGSLLAGC